MKAFLDTPLGTVVFLEFLQLLTSMIYVGVVLDPSSFEDQRTLHRMRWLTPVWWFVMLAIGLTHVPGLVRKMAASWRTAWGRPAPESMTVEADDLANPEDLR